MCFLLFAVKVHPDFPLIVAGNRDEYYERATAPAEFWCSDPSLLAGRDLVAGGTWLGVNRRGQFAALTNFRDGGNPVSTRPSRGELVKNYLKSDDHDKFTTHLMNTRDNYQGFNLVFGEPAGLTYVSNRTGDEAISIDPGFHALSNGALDEPWPKVVRGQSAFEKILSRTVGSTTVGSTGVGSTGCDRRLPSESIFRLLRERECDPNAQLPNTGVGLDRERDLAPIFIQTKDYGSRCSTVIGFGKNGMIDFEERRFNSVGSLEGVSQRRFSIAGANGS